MGFILIVLIYKVLLYSNGREAVPSELIGRWEANKNIITVRAEERIYKNESSQLTQILLIRNSGILKSVHISPGRDDI